MLDTIGYWFVVVPVYVIAGLIAVCAACGFWAVLGYCIYRIIRYPKATWQVIRELFTERCE